MTVAARISLAATTSESLIGVDAPNAVHRALRAAVAAGVARGDGLDMARIAEMDRLQGIEIVVGLEDTGLATAAHLSHVIDDPTASRRAFAELAEWAGNEGKEGIERVFLVHGAHAALIADDVGTAREAFDRSGHQVTSASLPGALRTAAGLLLIAEGRPADLVRVVEGWAGDQARDAADELESEGLLGLSALAARRWREAVGHLRTAADLADSAGSVEPGSRLRVDLPLVEALLQTGELVDARRRLDVVRAFLERHDRPISRVALHRVSSIESASRGDLAQALTHADTAVALAAALSRPTDEALALLQRARVLRRLRRVALARTDITAARDRAVAAGSVTLLEQVEEDHVAAGSARPAGALTRAEHGVLEVLQTGLSNREIAARLFISLRTVESHVAAILRKLGVATRVRLVGHEIPIR